MNTGIRIVGIALCAALVGGAWAQTFTFTKVNPRGTYLRDSQWEPGPTIIDISSEWDYDNSIVFGDDFMLEIRTVGWFNRAYDNPAAHNVSNEAGSVFAVHSGVDSDWTQQYRVLSPLEAGEEFFTFPTWEGNKATDIPEDFKLGPSLLQIRIPQTAKFLMVTPFDNGFYNNADDFSMPGADPRGFGVEWRVVQISSVPEPSSFVLLGLGLWRLGRRKKRLAPRPS